MNWEFEFLYALQEIHAPWLDKIMTFITTIGNSGVYNIWVIAGVVMLIFKKTRRAGIQSLITIGITALIGNLGIKEWVARLRPCDIDTSVQLLIHRPTSYSFPSGHSLNSLSAAMAIFFNNKKIGIPAVILAVLIGLSRLYHFVHFPTDVLAGFVLAIIVAYLIHLLFNKIIASFKHKKSK